MVEEPQAAEAPQDEEESLVLDPVVEELKAMKEQFLRLAAEFDNFKKRSQREKEEAYLLTKAEVIKAFLPVLDNFERAAAGREDSGDYRRGVQMIYEQFTGVFAAAGVESFGAPGDAFDPALHNAVMHAEDSEKGENEITDVYSKGYRLGEKIIREAMVSVVN